MDFFSRISADTMNRLLMTLLDEIDAHVLHMRKNLPLDGHSSTTHYVRAIAIGEALLRDLVGLKEGFFGSPKGDGGLKPTDPKP